MSSPVWPPVWPGAIIATIRIDWIADQILHFLTTHLCNYPPVRFQFNGTDAVIDAQINHCLTQLVNQAMNDFWNHLGEVFFLNRCDYQLAPTLAGFEVPRLISDILSSIRRLWLSQDTLNVWPDWPPIDYVHLKVMIYAPDPSLYHNFGRNRNQSVVDSEAVMKCISALNAANIPMGIIDGGIGTSRGRGSLFPTCRLNQREDGTYDVLGSLPHYYYTESDLTRAFFFDRGNPFENVSLFVGISSSLSLKKFIDEMAGVMTPQMYHAPITHQSHGPLASNISLDSMKLKLRDHLFTSPLTIDHRLTHYSNRLADHIHPRPTVIVARIWIGILHDTIFAFLLDNFTCFDPLLDEFQRTKEDGDELLYCIEQLVNQAMNDLWNRLRNIAGRHSLAARDQFFPGEAPTLEGFRLPQFIASILSSIGPLNVNLIPSGYTHMWEEREDRFNITIIYAPDSSENFYEVDVDVLQRFMRAVISSGIPVDTIDRSGTSPGSFFTTCYLVQVGAGEYHVFGNFGHSNYKQSDVIIASLFGDLGEPNCPFEDVAGNIRLRSLESESFPSGFSEPLCVGFLAYRLTAAEMKASLTQWLLQGYYGIWNLIV